MKFEIHGYYFNISWYMGTFGPVEFKVILVLFGPLVIFLKMVLLLHLGFFHSQTFYSGSDWQSIEKMFLEFWNLKC